MAFTLLNKVNKAIPIDSQGRISDAIVALARGVADGVTTGAAKATLTTDDFIHINSGNVDVVVPTAAEANKGKMFIIQFINATCDATDIVDDSETPNSIVAAAQIAQYDIFILVSAGDTSLGTNGYHVIGITGAAIA